MMTFQEWIRTQDESKFDLDQATIDGIKMHFMYREIVDDVKMPVFFWRTLNKYRARYKSLVRVESIEFDPLVNKYFEAEFSSDNRSTSDTIQNSTTDRNGKSDMLYGSSGSGETLGENSGSEITSDTSVLTKEFNTDTIKNGGSTTTFDTKVQLSGQDTVNDSKIESGKDTTSENKSRTETGSVDVDGSEIFSGMDTNRKTGGTTVSGTSSTRGSSTGKETANGKNITTADAMAIAKNANKQAPMNAANVTAAGGNSNGRLGQMDSHGNSKSLDFEFATAYSQADSETTSAGSETNNKTTDTTGTTTGNENHNENTNHNIQDVTSYGKNIHNGSTTDTNSSRNDTGTTDFSTLRDIKDINTTVYGKNESKTGNEGTTYNETVGVGEKGTQNTENNGDRNYNGNTSENYTKSESGNKNTVSTERSTGNYTNNANRTASEVNHNRYAGRDNLTPQRAMAEATDYLIGYSPAFQWLVDMLEPCFMAIYDI